MDKLPLLSIICTVFDQETYLKKCLDAVAGLQYPNLELFLVDNGSKDNSNQIMQQWVNTNPVSFPVKMISRESAMPYCKSFNEVLALTAGEYLIDLSGDDILLSQHALKSVNALENHPHAAVCFSDAFLSKAGKQKNFYSRDQQGRLKSPVQDGDIYEILVAKHHVLSVTMVIRTKPLKELGGYDESLSYEDFDVQVRLARRYDFVFSDHVGFIKTLHARAMSTKQYQRYHSLMLPSTLKICQKIKSMNRDQGEDLALQKRVDHELKHALLSANFQVACGFLKILEDLGQKGTRFMLYKKWMKYRWDISALYAFFKSLKD
jgi:glycosyltransferase involved in cell wall biosynthesis